MSEIGTSGRGSVRETTNVRKGRAGRHGRKVPLLLLLGTLLAVLAVSPSVIDWGALWEGTRRVFGSPEALKEYVLGFGVWAPVAFFLAQVAQVILAPIPGGVTTIAGPLLFGPWVGTALILAGGMVGSVVLFALVRRWGPPLAVGLVGRKNFKRFSGAFDDEKGMLLLVVMLVPFVPDDVAVAVAALSRVSFRRFVVLVALGRLPGWAATAFVASDLVGRSAGTLVTVGLAVAVATALVFVYRERLESRLLRSAGAERGRRERTREEKPSSGVGASYTASREAS